jgi:hypothetical protein
VLTNVFAHLSLQTPRSGAPVGGRGGLFKPHPSKSELGQISLPVVTSSVSATKRKVYLAKWTELLQLELHEEVSEIEGRLRSWSMDRLARDGFSLLNLSASFAGYRSEEALVKVMSETGGYLPFHRLSHGDMVRLPFVRSSPHSNDKFRFVFRTQARKVENLLVPRG